METLAKALPTGALVLTTERQLAFMVTWYTRALARRSVPASLDEGRTFRLIPSNALEPEMALALANRREKAGSLPPPPQDLMPLRPGSLTLLSEPAYQSLLFSLSPDSQRYWRDWPSR